jgi:uncharacterized protein
MERESFEDEEVAEILNREFISIKVDREERPDVDQIYMMVCQAMTGQGGWPLTIMLTPERKPFFAGTYFPKEDKYGRSGLVNILTKIALVWKEEPERADRVGNQIVEHIQTYLNPTDHGDIESVVLDHAFEQLAHQYDEVYGGLGDAPKFPRPHDLLFLLRYAKQKQDSEATQMVTHTLDQMHKGGIYDHLGYGFSRYSVDREWLVPHFEKMLYDQALLAIAYLEAFQVTGNKRFSQVANEIFTYVLRDMTSPEGAFYSAEDADSEGEEGKFYVWHPEEITHLLGEELGEWFCRSYGVTITGNFEHGTSILNQIHQSIAEVALELGISEQILAEKLNQAKEKLFAEREQRIHPHKDDKILTSWNGLMIAAFAYGARVLGQEKYEDVAKQAVRVIQTKLVRADGRLLVRYREGEAAYLGYLDDYAYLVWGLIELYESTFEREYLEWAIQLTEQMIELFGDPEQGGLYFSGHDSEQLISRSKDLYDGAYPSGNSVAAYNLIRLAKLTADEKWQTEAERQLRAFAGTVKAAPMSYSFFLIAMQFALGPTKEIVIAGKRTDQQTQKMIRLVQQMYLPDAVVAHTSPEMDDWIPLLEGKEQAEEPIVYVCENFACQAPTSNLIKLKELL